MVESFRAQRVVASLDRNHNGHLEAGSELSPQALARARDDSRASVTEALARVPEDVFERIYQVREVLQPMQTNTEVERRLAEYTLNPAGFAAGCAAAAGTVGLGALIGFFAGGPLGLLVGLLIGCILGAGAGYGAYEAARANDLAQGNLPAARQERETLDELRRDVERALGDVPI